MRLFARVFPALTAQSGSRRFMMLALGIPIAALGAISLILGVAFAFLPDRDLPAYLAALLFAELMACLGVLHLLIALNFLRKGDEGSIRQFAALVAMMVFGLLTSRVNLHVGDAGSRTLRPGIAILFFIAMFVVYLVLWKGLVRLLKVSKPNPVETANDSVDQPPGR